MTCVCWCASSVVRVSEQERDTFWRMSEERLSTCRGQCVRLLLNHRTAYSARVQGSEDKSSQQRHKSQRALSKRGTSFAAERGTRISTLTEQHRAGGVMSNTVSGSTSAGGALSHTGRGVQVHFMSRASVSSAVSVLSQTCCCGGAARAGVCARHGGHVSAGWVLQCCSCALWRSCQ